MFADFFTEVIYPRLYPFTIWTQYFLVDISSEKQAGKGNVVPPLLEVEFTQIPKRVSFTSAVTYLFADAQCLFVVLQGFTLFTQGIVDSTQIVEGGAFSLSITELLINT